MSLKSRYPILDRINLDSLYNTFISMPPREQIISLAGILILLFILIVLPISLASGYLSNMEEKIGRSQSQINEIVREIGSFDRLNSDYASISALLKQGANSSISSSIEGFAQSADIKTNVDSIKERPVVPSDLFDEVIVDVTVSKVTIEQLVDFMYRIESSKSQVLRVKKCQIKTRHDDRNLLNAKFSVSTYRLTGES